MTESYSYPRMIWPQYRHHILGMVGLFVVALFTFVGIYAPFFASGKPIVLQYEGHWYFPLFRYLFFRGYYTTVLDQFFNLLMFTLPLFLTAFWLPLRWRRAAWFALICMQLVGSLWLIMRLPHEPASNPKLTAERVAMYRRQPLTWNQELQYMNAYARINLLLSVKQQREQEERIGHRRSQKPVTTLWQGSQRQEQERVDAYQKAARSGDASASQRVAYLQDRRQWLSTQEKQLTHIVMPLLRPYHWEEDAGGDTAHNQAVPWWELTRPGHGDLTAALIFGIRVALVVGLLAVGIALCIGIPIGCLSGYYGGWIDIAVCRLMEIWEAMPTFFMLLFVVAILQTKSILLVIVVIGIFGWTGFSRYIRGEFFKQRHLPYVEACRAMGFHDRMIMFQHILPNAIPPLLTLLPFAIMGAISTEAGLSFLGLGHRPAYASALGRPCCESVKVLVRTLCAGKNGFQHILAR
jgi:peptide/nickel transport system permease protein